MERAAAPAELTAAGRDDVPDGLLFEDVAAKARAKANANEWQRYAHGLVVVESKRWARPLDRAGRRDEATAPSTQMLRYLRRIDDLTRGKLRWGILTNGGRWRLYWQVRDRCPRSFWRSTSRLVGPDQRRPVCRTDDRDHWLRVFAVMFGPTHF